MLIQGLNAANLHAFRTCERLYTKLAHVRSDIYFLSAAKKNDVIPKGFRIKNPLKSACAERVGCVALWRVNANTTIRPKPPRFCRKGALGALGCVSSANATLRPKPPRFGRKGAFIQQWNRLWRMRRAFVIYHELSRRRYPQPQGVHA